ncbi:class B sortase [Paenibacillus sp. LMG 31456]|uniref:Class B sortase n=1 Tax=Paenibacillus foliorum TaxID=2654974 RepID=A0A972K234_9BACL|nr:class B sortase [Paenibacillus foliorum]
MALGVFLFSFIELSSVAMGYFENRKALTEAQSVYYSSLEGTEQDAASEAAIKVEDKSDTRPLTVRPSFHGLLTVNPDITGWLKIADTLIDYPIVRAEDNEYYLSRNYKREDAKAGSIFMDFRNDVTTDSSNTILYGHRMKDGSMFGDLKKYMNRDFFETHRRISYDTLYASYDVEVFSVYYTTTDFNYIETEFSGPEDRLQFYDSIRQRSMYKSEDTLTEQDRLLTLSTCDYTLDPNEGRLVVHGRLVEKQKEMHSGNDVRYAKGEVNASTSGAVAVNNEAVKQ